VEQHRAAITPSKLSAVECGNAVRREHQQTSEQRQRRPILVCSQEARTSDARQSESAWQRSVPVHTSEPPT